tara:strand:- start:569 stop:781 length:213 start_codon:yes stop_codon:yes gene_type:complete
MTDREFGLTTTPLPAIRSSQKLIQTTDKEWVGLTDDEYEAMSEKYVIKHFFDTLKYAKAIEAKLKEKNYD